MENHIGSRIKKRRKELNLTQLQIKEETGISSGNLSDIENGNKLPSTKALLSLSKILDCSTDWILKGETPKRENDFLLNGRGKEMINLFVKLSEDDQEELLMIAQVKYDRQKEKKNVG